MNARWGLAFFFGFPILLVLVAAVLIRQSHGQLLAAPDERIVAQVASPSGRRTAEVVEIMGEAPTVDGYLVRVDGEEAFGASGGKGMTVRWRDDRTLEAGFGHAHETQMGKVKGLTVVPKGTVDAPHPLEGPSARQSSAGRIGTATGTTPVPARR